MAPAGQELTMFTGALAHVMGSDEVGGGRPLSFAEIAYEADLYIQRTHGLKAVRPQCHTPRQDAGDLARAPLFVNSRDDAVLLVSVSLISSSVSREDSRYRFKIKVEGINESNRSLGRSGVTINVPTIDSHEHYLATKINKLSSFSCTAPFHHGPGEEIFGFLHDGSFGKKAATCLLMECACEQWPRGECIDLEADLLTSCSRLDLHVRVWSTRPKTGDGFGDPDWKTTTQKDQQGIPVYFVSLGFDAARVALAPDPGEINGAAGEGDLEKVKALLQEKPDLVFSKNNLGETPLYWAAYHGQKDAAEVLLTAKADVNAKNIVGLTPLHAAAHRGHKDVAELLLANKAEVNAKENNGMTPLDFALMKDHKGVAELLR